MITKQSVDKAEKKKLLGIVIALGSFVLIGLGAFNYGFDKGREVARRAVCTEGAQTQARLLTAGHRLG